MRLAWAASTIAVLCMTTQVATGDPSEKRSKRSARALAKKGRKAYRAGKLEAAEDYLRRAYELDPAPTLLYNLARILDTAGDLLGAHDAYTRFLEVEPDAKERPLIDRRLTQINLQLAERKALEEAARKAREAEAATDEPTPEIPPQVPPNSSEAALSVTLETDPKPPAAVGPGPWALIGTGAGSLVAGTVFAFVAQSKASAARDEPIQVEADRLRSSAQTFATTRTILLIVGATALTAGIVWAVVNLTSDSG